MNDLPEIIRLNIVHLNRLERAKQGDKNRSSNTAWVSGARYVRARNQWKLNGKYYPNTPDGRARLDIASNAFNVSRGYPHLED